MQRIAIHTMIGKSDDASNELDLDLAKLFRQHYLRIYNYIRYRVDSLDDAEDLISVVFERAFTRQGQFNSTKGSFSSWLFRIAHNVLIDFYRTRKRRLAWETNNAFPADLVTPNPSPEVQLLQKESITHMLESLTHLSERDQEIISLKFAGKLKNKEIGEIIGMKEKTVSVALLRAMRRLRQQMEKEASL